MPYSQLLSLFPCYGSLKLTCFIKKIVFQLFRDQKVQLIGMLVPLNVILFTLSMENVLFILDILFSVTMVTC